MRGIKKTSMHRSIYPSVICTFIFILFFFKKNLPGYESRTSVQGEILRDIINYSDEEPTLMARGHFSENIDDTFLFNFSILRDINNDNYNYTWNTAVEGLQEHFDFTAGNYNLAFGSGLIMGKKKFMSADPFTRSLSVSKDEALITSTGTNPAGSFFGSAAKLYSSGDEFSAGVLPFFSSQRRYITNEELSDGKINASLATLSGRVFKDSKHSDEINILNYGGMAWFSWIDYLTIQGYGFSTEIHDSSGNELQWEYDNKTESGIRRYSSAGFFIEYADEVISFFIEPAVSSREYGDKTTGKALMWGFGVKNRMVLLKVRGKNSSPDFRSEYSSGGINPEKIFEISTGILPFKIFEIGGSVFSEKNLNPSYRKDYTGGTVREEIYSEIKPFRWIDFNFKTARARSFSDDLCTEKIKFSSSVLLTLPWNFFIRIKSDIQESDSSVAYVSACEIKYLFFDYFTFSAGYTDIRINNDNRIYAAVIPAAEAELCTDIYNESAKGGALKIRYRRDELSFHARGSLIETGGEKEITAESSLGFVF